jgi:hypothetical protein
MLPKYITITLFFLLPFMALCQQYEYKADSVDLQDTWGFKPRYYDLDDCFCPGLSQKDSSQNMEQSRFMNSPYKWETTTPIHLDLPDSTLQEWIKSGLIEPIIKKKEDNPPVL